jgi:ABC-type lipoprotein release transport system permease subunit
MPYRTLFLIAYRDLGRNRRRSFLTLLAVALGLALLIMMNGLVAGVLADTLQNAIRLQTGHVQLRAAGYDEDRLGLGLSELVGNPEGLAERARALPQVKAAAPILWSGGILATPEESVNLRVVGLDPDGAVFAPTLRDGLVAGAALAADDRGGILIGQRLAASLGLEVGSQVSLGIVDADGQTRQGEFTVRGLFATGVPTYDDGSVFLPLSRAQAFAGVGDRASSIVVLLHDENDAPAVAQALAAPGTVGLTWRELNTLIIDGVGAAAGYYVILDAIVMLVVAVVIANTLLMAVFERVREMGILAALGMKGRQIMQMFLCEAALLGLAGIAVGIGLGLVSIAYLATVGIHIGEMASATGSLALGTTMYARFAPSGIVMLSAWTLAIILAASLYPAWFAARLEPADALHRR